GLPHNNHHVWSAQDVIKQTQDEVFPYARNWAREGGELSESLTRLDALWAQISNGSPQGSASDLVKAREAAAMLATARWMYQSALSRQETRGMHRRRDYVQLDPLQRHRVTCGGLHQLW